MRSARRGSRSLVPAGASSTVWPDSLDAWPPMSKTTRHAGLKRPNALELDCGEMARTAGQRHAWEHRRTKDLDVLYNMPRGGLQRLSRVARCPSRANNFAKLSCVATICLLTCCASGFGSGMCRSLRWRCVLQHLPRRRSNSAISHDLTNRAGERRRRAPSPIGNSIGEMGASLAEAHCGTNTVGVPPRMSEKTARPFGHCGIVRRSTKTCLRSMIDTYDGRMSHTVVGLGGVHVCNAKRTSRFRRPFYQRAGGRDQLCAQQSLAQTIMPGSGTPSAVRAFGRAGCASLHLSMRKRRRIQLTRSFRAITGRVCMSTTKSSDSVIPITTVMRYASELRSWQCPG